MNSDDVPIPDAYPSLTRRVETGNGRVYVTISFLDGRPFEVFVKGGQSGGFRKVQTQAIGRLVSMWLQDGGDTVDVISALIGIRGPRPEYDQSLDRMVYSIPDAVALVLADECGIDIENNDKISRDGPDLEP